jgi:hypothetical protein
VRRTGISLWRMDGVRICGWLVDCPGVTEKEQWKSFLWKSGVEYTEDDTKRLWEGVDLGKWMGTWCGIEKARRDEMKDEPHW